MSDKRALRSILGFLIVLMSIPVVNTRSNVLPFGDGSISDQALVSLRGIKHMAPVQ